MKTRSETVAFRADETLLREIDDARGSSSSRGIWVRDSLNAYLHTRSIFKDFDPNALSDLIEQVESRLTQLELNLRLSLFYMLTIVGEMPPNDARELVKSKFSDGKG